MFRRRRPLARAAVVGGAAYAVGRRSGRNNAEEQYEQAAPQEAPQPDVGLPDGAYDELEKLAKLKDQGILTQEEFDTQKAKILESS